VSELNELLRPSWGAEKWILEGWNKINSDERQLIKDRMDDLFKDGLPFQLKHDKLAYIYTFSLLAQLEVLAIQVPLRFEEKMSTPQFKQQMRTQLLDEIFHGMVFTKIVYMLCAPYAVPPTYNESFETLCNFIRDEECPKVGVVLLNLVAEGWIEEVFKSFYRQQLAPKVFEVILADEHRHVCEADLYNDIGIPDLKTLTKKLEHLEGLLLTSVSLQPKYLMAIYALLGGAATCDLIASMNEKHTAQLKKIKLRPGKQWVLLMQMAQEMFSRFQSNIENEVDMTPLRKTLMTQWNSPGDPMVVGQLNMDVSFLDIYNKKYPSETLTTLMLQSVSHLLTKDDSLRNFLSHKRMHQARHAYVAIVVRLPDCGDHIGNIVFKDCHTMSVFELSLKIRQILQMMVYCYKKRELLETEYLHLKSNLNELLYEYAHSEYPYPVNGSPVVSLSSIGFCGYAQAISPLRKQEGLKFTLLTVERKLIWSEVTQAFEPRDMLPVSISADHRIFDGHFPFPDLLNKSLQLMFQQMQEGVIKPVSKEDVRENPNFKRMVDKMLKENLELGYRLLVTLQNTWSDFIDFEDLFNTVSKKTASDRMAEALG
jgi:hypothetical protein